jgi:hypothetical protein
MPEFTDRDWLAIHQAATAAAAPRLSPEERAAQQARSREAGERLERERLAREREMERERRRSRVRLRAEPGHRDTYTLTLWELQRVLENRGLPHIARRDGRWLVWLSLRAPAECATLADVKWLLSDDPVAVHAREAM